MVAPLTANPQRRVRFGRAAALAALAVAPIATYVFGGSSDFVNYPSSVPQREASRVICEAGYGGRPGGRPGAKTIDDIKEALSGRLRPGYQTEDMQMDRVAKKSKWLKSLKGKFVPYGPKPWDPHVFKKACIQVRLQSKQASNTKLINQCVEELRRISGVHPTVVNAKHNVATWGWRRGFPCGVAVTMKGQLMNDFLARLNTIILPRVRDFEGLDPSGFDNYGNFWMGFENQEPFKELDEMIDSRELVHGFDVGIINNCLTQPDGLKLMKDFGFPFGDASGPNPVKIIRKWSGR